MSITPPRLKKQGVIGIIAPSSPLKDYSHFRKGIQYIESLGYRTEVGKNVYQKENYLAGSDADRVQDLHVMFSNKNIDAIFCARGGYGCSRLLPLIDFSIIKKNPKIFVGFSDVTALLNAIYHKTGLITFHGPMVEPNMKNFDPFTEEHFWKLITSSTKEISYSKQIEHECDVLREGVSEGILLGGNLTVFNTLIGTPYFPSTKNAIVCIEDIDEPLYKIDRMLSHWVNAVIVEKLSGLIFGQFTNTINSTGSTLEEVQKFYSSKLTSSKLKNSAVVSLQLMGHIQKMITLPIGAMAQLRAKKNKISFKIIQSVVI